MQVKYHIQSTECCIGTSMALFLMRTETYFNRQKFKAQFELSKIQRLSRFVAVSPQQKRQMIGSLRLIKKGWLI